MLPNPSKKPSNTCVTCHARKITCDGQRDICNNCMRLGLTCSYDDPIPTHTKTSLSAAGPVDEALWDAGPQETYTPSEASASLPPTRPPTKLTRQIIPTVHDHTTDRLGPGGDEYLPNEIDNAGENKVMPNGALYGGREYRCRTFLVQNRGDKLFMLATECARVLGYSDSNLLFNKNRSLHEISASQTDKDDLVSQGILPFSYRSRKIPIVTARSIFRQFGSRVIVDGRKVRDDYWETRTRKEGFTDAEVAGEARSGAFKAGGTDSTAAGQILLPFSGYQGRVVDGTAFIHYRRDHEAGVDSKYPGLEPLEISRILIKLWFEEKEEVRNHWRRFAESSPDPGMTIAPHMESSRTPIDLSSDNQSAAVSAHRDGPTIPETVSQAAEAFPEQHHDDEASGEWRLFAEGIPMGPSGLPRLRPLLELPAPGSFDYVLSLWNSANTAELQLHLLDSLEENRPTTMPEAVAAVGSTWQGWLRCEWEFPSVVEELQQLKSNEVQQLLGDFVIITGSGSDMECSTCAQFLEKEWKESGIRALEVLSRGVSLLQDFSTNPSGSKTIQNTMIQATGTHIIVGVGEDQQDAQSFIDAFVWACTAVRVNPQRQTVAGQRSHTQMSRATQLLVINSGQSPALVYGLERLIQCSSKDLGPEAKCWAGLFDSGIVAYHPLSRQWGAGLEISFDMMVHLSGVENVYHIDNGIILVGFFTALVPIFHDPTTNSVQWHLEEVDASSGKLLRPSSLPSVLGTWYRSQDINVLRTSKCFVGWFARANILLGTRQLIVNSQNRLKWSTETREHRQSVRREGFEAAGQLGFTAGPINTGLQFVSTWRFHSNVQHFHRHEQYSTALRLARGNVAVIIDSESKQVWLVPMLSAVLHLCHRYFQEVNSDTRIDDPLPFADPSPDGASEAARVLEPSGDVLVFGAAGDPDAENLRQLFLRINTNLLNAAATREPSNKKTLFASELMEMVTEPGRGSPLKKMKAPDDVESWVGLLDRVDFVGVCADIGHLIEPELPSTNPCPCSALPSDKYLLAAHMRCLGRLSQREGGSVMSGINPLSKVCCLGERVFWNVEKLYWASCPAGAHEPIWNEKDKVLQQISSKERDKGKNVSELNGPTVRQQHLPEDGVVVFGGYPPKRILQSLRWGEYIL